MIPLSCGGLIVTDPSAPDTGTRDATRRRDHKCPYVYLRIDLFFNLAHKPPDTKKNPGIRLGQNSKGPRSPNVIKDEYQRKRIGPRGMAMSAAMQLRASFLVFYLIFTNMACERQPEAERPNVNDAQLPVAVQEAKGTTKRPLEIRKRTIEASDRVIAWEAIPDASTYQVQVCANPTFTKDCLILDAKTEDTEYRIPEKTYQALSVSRMEEPERIFWRVRAGFEAREQVRWSNWSSIWWIFGHLDPPQNLQPNMIQSASQAEWTLCPYWGGLAWKPVDHATRYQVQVAVSDFSAPILDVETVNPRYADEPIEASTSYRWRVRAKNSWHTGPWSVTAWYWSSLAWPEKVDLLTPPNGAPNVPNPVSLEWTEDPNAYQYEVSVDDNGTLDSPEVLASTSAPPFITEILVDGTPYFWRVRSSNPCSIGQWSDVRSFTPYCASISSPNQLSPLDDDSVDIPIQLLWYGVAGAEKYQLQIDNDQSFGSPEIDEEHTHVYPNFLANSLSANTTYFWRLRANNGCRWSDWGAAWRFTTCNSPIQITLNSPMQDALTDVPATFSWTADGAATNYQIQVSDDASFSTPAIDSQTLENSYSTSDLGSSSSYHWRVRAHSGCAWGEWSESSQFSTCAADIDVALLDPVDGYEYDYPFVDPVLSWSDESGAVSYEIEIGLDSDFTQFVRQLSSNEPVITVQNLLPTTAYYWRVRTSNGCSWSSWSESQSFVTGYEGPIPTSPNDYAIDLNSPVLLTWEHPRDRYFVVEWWDQISPSDTTRTLYTTTCIAGFCIGSEGIIGREYQLGVSGPGHTYVWHVGIMYTERVCPDFSFPPLPCSDEVRIHWGGTRTFTLECPALAGPSLNLPVDQDLSVGSMVVFDWDDIVTTQAYRLQVDDDPMFGSLEIDQTRIDSDSFSTGLTIGITYYWRVRGADDCGAGSWSSIWSFTP